MKPFNLEAAKSGKPIYSYVHSREVFFVGVSRFGSIVYQFPAGDTRLHCDPSGHMRMLTRTHTRQILLTPAEIGMGEISLHTILFEAGKAPILLPTSPNVVATVEWEE